MTQLLLIDNQMIVTIGAVAGGVIALAMIVWGAVRKFTRLTWIGWQVPLVFAITPIFRLFPADMNSVGGFLLRAGGLALAAGLVLAVGGIVRHMIFDHKRVVSRGWVVVDRLLGIITAPLNLVVFFGVLGVVMLSALEAFAPIPALDMVFTHPVWANFFGQYAIDIFMCAVFVLVMRAGYRLGLLRALYAILMLALTLVCIFGAILLTLRVGFMGKFAMAIAGAFKNLHFAVAAVLGYGIVILLVFAIFFTIVMILGRLLDKLIRKVSSVRIVDIVSGLIISIAFSAAFFAVVCALNFGIAYLAQGNLVALLPESVQEIAAQLGDYAGKLAEWITSSPLSRSLYELNPLLQLIA